MTMTERCAAPDVGREAVYAAEEATFGGTDVDEPVALADLVARAATVVGGTWWQSCQRATRRRRHGPGRRRVIECRGSRAAEASSCGSRPGS